MKGANDLTKPRFLLPIPRKALNSLTLACLIFFHYCNSNILMFPLRGFYRITSYISSSSLTTSEHSLRAYLRGCFPGLSPQQVCWIKHTFQLWGCAFFSSTTLHHQGNANQNQKLRYHLTPVRTVIIKRWLVLERMRRKENPLVLFVPCWWPSHCGKQSGDSTQKKTEPPCDPTIPLLDIYPKKTKTEHQRDICAPKWLQLYSEQSRYGNHLCPSVMSVDKDAIDTYNGILFRHEKKKENLAICDNMDGSWCYAKWDKSDKEGWCLFYI